METATIKSIKGLLPAIETNLNSFRQYFKDQKTDLEAAQYCNSSKDTGTVQKLCPLHIFYQ